MMIAMKDFNKFDRDKIDPVLLAAMQELMNYAPDAVYVTAISIEYGDRPCSITFNFIPMTEERYATIHPPRVSFTLRRVHEDND